MQFNKKVLIVIDMQNDFVSGSLANPAAQAIVSLIAQKIRSFDGDVIATRDTHFSDYLSTSEGKNLPVLHCVAETNGWRIVDEIANAIKEKPHRYINKTTFGNVLWFDLENDGWNFDEYGYEEAEVVGTCTDICVVSNVLILKALYPDLKIKVHANLCAGLTEEKHLAALEVMKSCQVEVVYD